MVIARGVEACVDGRMVNGQQQSEALVLVNLEPEFLMAVPLVVFSLGCHLQVVPVYHSLKVFIPHCTTRPAFSALTRANAHTQREKKPWMSSILVGSVITCITAYLATGVMGYLRFGDDSEG
jgi:amino acid permease